MIGLRETKEKSTESTEYLLEEINRIHDGPDLRTLVASGVPSSRRWALWTWSLAPEPGPLAALAETAETAEGEDAETAKVEAWWSHGEIVGNFHSVM